MCSRSGLMTSAAVELPERWAVRSSPRIRLGGPRMNIMLIGRIGGQAMAIYDVVREIRKAEAKGDKLRLFDAMVNVLAIATAIAIIIRGTRRRHD